MRLLTSILFLDGTSRPVFLDADGRQYVLDSDGKPVFGSWVHLDEPEILNRPDNSVE